MSLANRLRALMRWRGIHSQNQLARISSVPQSCIHRILTRADGYSPSRATLIRLATALDTSVPWLSDGVISAVEPHAKAHGAHYGAPNPAAHSAPHAGPQRTPHAAASTDAAMQAGTRAAAHAFMHAALPASAPEVDGYCAEICVLLRQQPDSTKKTVLSMVRLMVESQTPGAGPQATKSLAS
ncbi:helix-turn-helix domain-containing protein [Achromobacter sp. NPDC008082]|uniref:helix-turn-helix domain-containing protein n=1 Tax=Achromobacter sp. NPDC008082 TaxID=3363888 RepID=UPI0036E8537D